MKSLVRSVKFVKNGKVWVKGSTAIYKDSKENTLYICKELFKYRVVQRGKEFHAYSKDGKHKYVYTFTKLNTRGATVKKRKLSVKKCKEVVAPIAPIVKKCKTVVVTKFDHTKMIKEFKEMLSKELLRKRLLNQRLQSCVNVSKDFLTQSLKEELQLVKNCNEALNKFTEYCKQM